MSSVRPVAISEAEQARLSSIDRAVAIGSAAVPSLMAMLTESSWMVRRAVVRGLAALGDPAIPALVETLRVQRDDETRLAAVVDALSLSTGDADAAALDLARDGNAAVVCDGMQILGRRRTALAVPLLGTLVGAPDENIAVAAIEALGRIGGSQAVERLVEAALSNNFFRVFPAIDVLGRTGDPGAITPLATLLGEPLYALEAARALARTGDGAAVLPLSKLLLQRGDRATRTRTSAVALAELHQSAAERHGSASSIVRALRSLPNATLIARRLSHCLRDADPTEKTAICAVLGSLGSEESVAILTDLVESPPPVGPAAEAALARLAGDLQPELYRMLRDGNSAQRLAVLPLVARPLDGALLAACLEDADHAVRAQACAAIGRLSDPSLVGLLFERLGDPDASVGQAAVAAIQSLGGAETERRALELSRSSDSALRRAALRILAYFGFASALDTLTVAMNDPDQRIRDAGINGLSFVEGPRANAALLGAASSDSARTRAAAMKALGHRVADTAVTDALVRGMSDRDAWVRYYACQSLGKLGLRETAPQVEALLSDPAGHVRVAALEALSQLGGESARRALIAAAHSDDEDVRRAALVGLGMMSDPDALKVLLSAATAKDPMTRLIAVSALSEFTAPEVVPALVTAAGDGSEAVRTAALERLGSRVGPEPTAALIQMVRSAETPERLVATLATTVEGRLDGIVAALFTTDERLARNLVSVLGHMETEEATSALLNAMTTHPAVARRAVATTLGALGTPAARAVLRHAATNDDDPDVRRIAELLVK